MQPSLLTLQARFKTVIAGLGYELLGVEFRAARGSSLLRVYIDGPAGIGLDDCQRVSEQLSALLDVEDPIEGTYNLEVSSPGLDRPLFEIAHFLRFIGHPVRIQLRQPQAGQRKFKGILRDVQGTAIILTTETGDCTLPLTHIESARLIPEWPRRHP